VAWVAAAVELARVARVAAAVSIDVARLARLARAALGARALARWGLARRRPRSVS
jgi:hypothetical protein